MYDLAPLLENMEKQPKIEEQMSDEAIDELFANLVDSDYEFKQEPIKFESEEKEELFENIFQSSEFSFDKMIDLFPTQNLLQVQEPIKFEEKESEQIVKNILYTHLQQDSELTGLKSIVSGLSNYLFGPSMYQV